MNFFGHAAVAAHFRCEPAFLLGAMLPDFSTMILARTPPIAHELMAQGVRFHHATDDAFHELESFRDLCRAAFRTLLERGLGRGSARAVAHVGVELVIDEVLAEAETARRAYISALEISRTAEIEAAMAWQPGERERYDFLIARLSERGVGAVPPAGLLAERLRRTLSGRPRLAFEAGETIVVEEWIVEARPVVVALVPTLTEALIAKLRRSMAGPPAATA
ncbi:MAG TPA: hypothetical protein VGP93_20705 [Polyangiaceae bacterium]|jgi:hypothetical protein|nr:hypothetical protein [Polyangiaceae bacterium]